MISNYLGLARKAGLLINGSEKVLEKIKNKVVKLVLISSNSSDNTKKKFLDKTKFYQVPAMIIDHEIISKIYKDKTPMILGVIDDGLAAKIIAIKGDGSNG